MNDHWGTERQQPHRPQPSTRTEVRYIVLTCVASTVAVVGLVVDATTPLDAPTGIYPLLVALGVVGASGWRSQRDRAASRRDIAHLLARVEELHARAPVAAPQGRQDRAVPSMPRVDDRARGRWRTDVGDPSGQNDLYWRVYTDVLEDLGGLDGPAHPS
ncbi:hypothetical protein [Micromonospora sp. C41]|uniref:hypothetical protein n=1 Tax=Micromonospora sp. C41 TaxID=2824878 RepID=UPI001B370AA3|nr:hypothetical protein [Micromonospora sp. C41]MBQ1061342.1 hypothetical protein [Micromonospora sp. C41]